MDNIGHWNIDKVGEFDEDDWYGFVYLITNLKNSMQYIGRKNFRIKRRVKVKNRKNCKITYVPSKWQTYTTSSTHVKNAIEEYGKENFLFEIIELCSSKGELSFREVELQWDCKVLSETFEDGSPRYYNKNIGAIKFRCEGHTEETIRKISEKVKGRTSPLKGKPSRMTEESKQTMIDKQPNSRSICQIDPNNGDVLATYKSIASIARVLNKDRQGITGCCVGKTLLAYDYIWLYEDECDEILIQERMKQISERTSSPLPKSVIQLDADTENIIATFASLTEAEKETNILRQCIGNVCNGKQKTAGGFVWKYKL